VGALLIAALSQVPGNGVRNEIGHHASILHPTPAASRDGTVEAHCSWLVARGFPVWL
jgi:hypothetical protein